jgi:hypothetical protein
VVATTADAEAEAEEEEERQFGEATLLRDSPGAAATAAAALMARDGNRRRER